MSLSPDQLARRLAGITATDVAAIVGVHPYRSRIDIWLEKRGQAPEWVDTERSRWGDLLEPVIRSDYAERHGVRVEVPGTLAHPQRDWLLATPDGIVYQIGSAEPERGLEIKTHTYRVAHLYGAPGTDEVPLHELCQCAINLAVTGLERWDLVPFIDGQPTEYTILRDEELIAGLTEQCERFLVDNVHGGAVPEPDGSDGFTAWLNKRWDKHRLPLAAPSPEAVALIARAKEIRAQGAELDDEHAKISQTLKLEIGEAEGLSWLNERGKPEKLTWKRSKSSKRVDYAGLARDCRNDAGLTHSARAGEVARALACLRSLGATTAIGHSSQAAITAGEVAELITVLQSTLSTIAHRADAAYTTEIPGPRPFVFPKNWKAPASAKEE